MCRLRAEKVARVADFVGQAKPDGPATGDLLVLSWGGTFGAVYSAVHRVQEKDKQVAHLHLRHLNPFPKNLGEILTSYDRVLIPELNLGQLSLLIRAKYLVDTVSYTKVEGMPFTIVELEERIEELLQ